MLGPLLFEGNLGLAGDVFSLDRFFFFLCFCWWFLCVFLGVFFVFFFLVVFVCFLGGLLFGCVFGCFSVPEWLTDGSPFLVEQVFLLNRRRTQKGEDLFFGN